MIGRDVIRYLHLDKVIMTHKSIIIKMGIILIYLIKVKKVIIINRNSSSISNNSNKDNNHNMKWIIKIKDILMLGMKENKIIRVKHTVSVIII